MNMNEWEKSHIVWTLFGMMQEDSDSGQKSLVEMNNSHLYRERVKFTKTVRWLILWWWLQARIASQTLPKQERKRTLRLLNLERLVVIQFLFKFSYDFLLLFGIWPVQSCSSVHTRCSRWFADQLLAMVESSGEYNKPIKHHDHRFSDCPTHTDPVPNGS